MERNEMKVSVWYN